MTNNNQGFSPEAVMALRGIIADLVFQLAALTATAQSQAEEIQKLKAAHEIDPAANGSGG